VSGGGRVLDDAAIIDIIVGKTMYGRALWRVAVEARLTLVLPAVALQAAWQQVSEEYRPYLERLLYSERIQVDALDTPVARSGGVRASDRGFPEAPVALAHAVEVAHKRGLVLVTGAPESVFALDPHLPYESLP
jgi:hypothetical protein